VLNVSGIFGREEQEHISILEAEAFEAMYADVRDLEFIDDEVHFDGFKPVPGGKSNSLTDCWNGEETLSMVDKVPKFDPTYGLVALSSIFDLDCSDEQYLRAGWPKHMVSKVRRYCVRGGFEEIPLTSLLPPQPGRSEASNPLFEFEALPGKSRASNVDVIPSFVKSILRRRVKGKHEFISVPIIQTHWSPIFRTVSRSRKPITYDRVSFRYWVTGELNYLSRNVVYPHFVTGNNACQLLFSGPGSASISLINSWLAKAEVFVSDHRFSMRKPTPIRVSDNMNRDWLIINGKVVTSVRQLNEFNWSKSKCLFKICSRYLEGDETVDLIRLQRTLDKIEFKQFIYQGAVASSAKREVSEVLCEPVNLLHSRPIEVVHTIDISVPEVMASLGVNEKMVRSLTGITALVISVFTSTSVPNALAALTLYVNGNDRLFKYCFDKISAMAGRIQYQGFGSFGDFFRPLWDAVVSCGLIEIISVTFGSLAEMICPLVWTIVSKLKSAMMKESIEQIAKSIVAAMQTFLGSVIESVKIGSFAPLWGPDWSPKEWIRESISMMSFFVILTINSEASPRTIEELAKLRKLGSVSDKWLTPVSVPEFIMRGDAHMKLNQSLISYFRAYPGITLELSRRGEDFRKFLDSIKLQGAELNERVEPFFVYFYGRPGVGKTSIVDSLIQAVATRFGFDGGSAGVYPFQPTANFQDGLRHSHWGICFDDVDVAIKPASAGVRNHIEEIIALKNSKPYPIEAADIAFKGKYRAHPLLLTYSSNFFNANAHLCVGVPHAFYRRIDMHVYVEVKKEFRTSSGTLDVNKARDSNTHDMFDITLCRYQANEANVNLFLGAETKMSFPAFMRIFMKDFAKHMKDQTDRLAEKVGNGLFCLNCGLTTDKICGCPKVRPQGGIVAKCRRDRSASFRSEPEGEDSNGVERPPFSVDEAVSVYNRYTRSGSEKTYFEAYQDYISLINAYCGGWIYESKSFFRELDLLNNELFQFVTIVTVLALVRTAINVLVERAVRTVVQGREHNSTTGYVPPSWHRADQTFKPGVPGGFGPATFTKEDVDRVVSESMVEISTDKDRMWAVIYAPSVLLVPSHIFLNDKNMTVYKDGHTVEYSFDVNTSRVLPSNKELMVVFIPGLAFARGIHKHVMFAQDEMVQQFDEVEIHKNILAYKPSNNHTSSFNGSRCLLTNGMTVDGDCGMLYVARHNTSWKIAAMHYAITSKFTILGYAQTSIGAFIGRNEINKLVESLSTKVDVPVLVKQSMCRFPGNVTFSKSPASSEVWAVGSHHPKLSIQNFGTISPPLGGSTMKTKVLKSMMYDEANELCEKVCGSRDYYCLPNFRGSMINGGTIWSSPFTNAFMTQNTVVPPFDLMALAIYDYVNDIEALDRTGYSVLSREEALIGVLGSNIGGVNLKTSAGPPFSFTKHAFYIVDHENREAYSAPEMEGIFDEFDKILSDGNIPIIVGTCTLKDEPLKVGKMPRVFVCLPAEVNIASKMSFAPIQQFMRANCLFFESMVGINMTSLESNKIVTFFKGIDPTLTQLSDGDVKALDKSWSPWLFHAVSMVLYIIASSIEVDPERVRLLVLCLRYTVFNIKNDMFNVTWNPSGCDPTVLLNGILMSLGERIVYYSEHPFKGDMSVVRDWYSNILTCPFHKSDPLCSFRNNVALVTYGDDNLKATRFELGSNYLKLWKDLVGLEMTAADKTAGTLTWKTLDQVQFLKRTFIWNDRSQIYFPALDRKSIVKMLMFKKDSILTLADHACVVMSEVLREAFYHGEEYYEEMFQFTLKVAEKYNLSINPNLDIQTYEHWFVKSSEEGFRTWSLRAAVPAPIVEGEPILQSSRKGVRADQTRLIGRNTFNMSNTINLVKGSNDEPISQGEDTLSHATGLIVSENAQISPINVDPTFYQKIEANPIGDFFQRATLIATTPLSGSDFGLIHTFDPWDLYLNNPAVKRKMSNFSYLKANIEVIGVVTMPGAGYGRYVVSAMPNCYPVTLAVSPDLIFQNMLQVDHVVMIDGAASDSVVLQLEWVWPYDYACTLPSIGLIPGAMWQIQVNTLVPISTAVVGGVTSGHIQWYASLMADGMELIVPHLQGKKLKPTAAMKSLAPAEHKKALKASDVVSKVGNAASELGKAIPFLAPFTSTFSQVATIGGSLLSAFGFTRESKESNPVFKISKDFSSLARVDGIDPSEVAGLMSANKISEDPRLDGLNGEDQLAAEAICNRYTLINTVTWSPSHVSGFVLLDIPVTPFYNQCVANALDMRMTTAGYFGLPFSYWRADMVYKFIIPVSKLHRGTLQFYWIPIGSVAIEDPTNTAINLIYDVNAGEDLELVVGFSREVPYLPCTLITNFLPIIPLGTTNGFLRVVVVNPLLAQDPLAATTINVFSKAINVSFAVPRDQFAYIDIDNNPVAYQIASDVILQGALGDEDRGVSVKTVTLVQPGKRIPGDALYFGETIMSARALMQKFSGTNITLGSVQIPIMFGPPNLAVTGVNWAQAPWTWATWYSNLFLGVATSERYKILVVNAPTTVGICRSDLAFPLLNSTMMPIVHLEPGKVNGTEVKVPYYYPRKFVLTREVNLGTSGASTLIWQGLATQYAVWYAFGDDIRVTSFRQVPVVTFRPVSLTPVVRDWLGMS